jgi:hypothetical protein
MVNGALSRETALPTILVEYGFPGRAAVGFRAIRLNTNTAASEHPALRTGPNVDRTGRAGLFAFVMDDLSGGFRTLSTIGSYGFDKTFLYKNEGVMTHIPGIATLAYALTSQSSVISGDFTGYNAGNRRVHSVNWAAATGQRFIALLGPHLIKDTSVSDPILIPPATADNITDDVLTAWIGPISSTSQVLIIGTDGQSDDIKYTTDPTADDVQWTSLVTFANANDRCWAGAWMPQLGTGWHVFQGKINDVDGWYAFKPTDTVPLTSTSLTPVVYEATKDEVNDDNPQQSTAAIFAHTAVTGESASGWAGEAWSSIAEILDDDGSYATAATNANQLSEPIGGLFDFRDELPPGGAVVTGFQHTYQRLESNAAANQTAHALFIGTAVTQEPTASTDTGTETAYTPLSINKADTAEFGTTVEEITTGDTTSDFWGMDFSLAEWRSPNLGVFLVLAQAVAGHTISVEAWKATIGFKRTGTHVTGITQGGWTIGPMPSDPNTLPTIEPVIDQETAITAQRVLKLNRFAFDTDGGRPVMASIEIPPVSMGYVGVAAHFQGGVVVIGGNNSTVFNECKLVDSEGIVRNLNMPKTHAGTAITAVKAVAQGNVLLVWVANVANTDAQLWMFFDGAWHALGPLQSKSSAITQRPIYWAETVNGLEQSQGYLLIPNSTTSLMGTRQFIAPGLFDDPALHNTTQLRHNGPLAVTTPILDMGTIETIKALLTLQAQSFQLDDDTLYGSARLEIDTTGDQTFATPAVDVTFGTDTGDTNPFVDYNVVEDTNKPGVLIPTATMRLTLDSGTGVAKSPQPLPIVFWMTGIWPRDSEYAFFAPSVQGAGQNNRHIYDRLISLSETKPVQRLAWEGTDGGSVNVPAAFLDATFEQSMRFATVGADGKPVTNEYRGTIFRFRSLPGGLE